MGSLSSSTEVQPFKIKPLYDASPCINDISALRALADENGYLFFRALIEPASVLQVRHEVLELCQRAGWLAEGAVITEGIERPGIRLGSPDDQRWLNFLSEALALTSFRALGLHPVLLAVLAKIHDGDVVPHCGDVCRVVAPDTAVFTTPPHQDANYIKEANSLWTAWLPLGDCPLELGALAVLPASHKLGRLPHTTNFGGSYQGVAVADDAEWAASDLRPGDVILFDSLTIHRACHNLTSDELRLSADYRFRFE